MYSQILSIILAIVANIVIGSLWYSPKIFGETWMRLKNIKPEDMKGEKRGYIISVISALILAVILNIFINMPRVITIYHAIFVSLLVWAGFAITTQLQELAWGDKPIKLFLIDIAHQLISYTVMGIILFLL